LNQESLNQDLNHLIQKSSKTRFQKASSTTAYKQLAIANYETISSEASLSAGK
jgi:hypothetical protein